MTTDLDLFKSLYCRVDDAYGRATITKPVAVREPLTDAMVTAHLEGRERIGAYLLDQEGRSDRLVFDIDEWNPDLARAITRELAKLFINAYILTSKSRGFHIPAHFEIPVPASDLRRLGKYIAHRTNAPDTEIFPKQDHRDGPDGLGNFVWLPLHGESLRDGKTAILDDGNGLDPLPDQWEALSNIRRNSVETLASAMAVVGDWERASGNNIRKAAPPVAGIIPEKKRNNTLFRFACSMRRPGMTEGAMLAALRVENAERVVPPLGDDELQGIARRAAGYEPSAPLVPDEASGIEAETRTGLEPLRPTDLWNAQLFVRLHGSKVRYCDRMGGWYFYDGKRWTRADGGEIERLAKETVRHLYEMAALEPDDKKRQEIAKHAAKSEAVGKIDAMLELAKTEEGIIVAPDAFDRDPWLFNTQTGTLDLRTGKEHPHRPEDLITNISPAEWRGLDAPAPLFEKFINEAMDGDREKIDFLQRSGGYTLSGDMREQVFFFGHGPEAAGKGTFIRAKADVMGTYAQPTEIETFLVSRRESVRNDIASLVGARLVTASEPEDGQSFDEGLIKILTGQDKTKARFLFREAFEFSATFKIWLQGNHRPHIRSTGGAMWRRLLIVPFEKTVPEEHRDKLLGDKLKSPEERAGILAWAVRGCLEWLRDGLKPPEKIKAAVAEYRAAEDRIAPFLEDCCEIHPSGAVPAAQLYARYKAWAEGNGERPISKRSFGMRLSEKGFESGKSMSTRKWFGLVLITNREPGTDDE